MIANQQPKITEILEKLEKSSPNSILAEHIKHTINQPPTGLPLIYQLKIICAIAGPEAKVLLGDSLFEQICKS